MTRALIVGAGIAGPATAMALQRVGISATVYEAHPRTGAEVGSYLTVTPNGLAALRAIDAHQAAVAVGFPTRQNVMWSAGGERLGAVPLGRPLPDGTVSQSLKRARLSRALEDEAIRRGVRVEYGKRLTGAETTPDGGVLARFADGSTARGDLLIGADGIHSPTRRIIDPSAPAGRYVGLTNFGGYTPHAGLSSQPEAWHLIFGRRAFFGYSLDPSGGAVWFANVPRPPISPDERAATSAGEWQRRLIDLFAADHGPAADLIRRGALDLAADNTFHLPHVPTWHRGPMIVIGDAAHAPSPSSGQGASLALEDAVVLARCLRDLPTIPDAFAAYERLRRARVERIVAQGARSSSAKTPGPAGRLLRDLILRVVFRYVVTEKSLAWMYDYRVDLAQPVQRELHAA
ncbi:MAG TPA: FAD-dependent monooxygenase [Chloroflexota bacterium]|nr:FAD-dependent monooxygenase [Chloroflexota bacterium]